MKTDNFVILAALFLVLMGAAIGFAWDATRDTTRAAALYLDQCASCHGSALEGQSGWRQAVFDSRSAAPPLNGTGHASLHSDDMLLRTMMRKAWPGVGHTGPDLGAKYPDGEFEDLLAWIKTHWPKRELSYQQNLTEWAEERTGPR
ncbi:c-type cytochrome [Salipiger mangrovisoli]|uniref:C-type cytochrome n=1 Tax=Salipiger mangrovisoli TaxID=2865933 RepID=A0ABR9X6W5_9RHOB|nr:c-type cytochrome [Salipiger mangrovisoli]MBE9639172.1 c-type cytochrome [Salipiger mangrovisoli]